VAFRPLEARGFFRGLAPPGTELLGQEGADLGERMALAFARGFAAGFGPVLLRGSDVPDLPAAVVSEAKAVLAAGQVQVVLGPCPDGGYYLVGLAAPQPPLFQGPAWSSSTVLTDTLRRARQLGLRVHLLPPWPDIDTDDNLRTFLQRARPAPQPGWRSREQARRLLGLLETNEP
jgi:rSAM/selenodomain-associated transferase 1